MSTEDPKRFVDPWGSGMWGYGGIPDRPGDARISGAKAIGLRELVLGILRARGLPEPPEDAWSSD